MLEVLRSSWTFALRYKRRRRSSWMKFQASWLLH
jgi:hypothetical protein